MEQGRKRVSPVSVFFAFFCFLLLRLLCFSGSAEAYKNYTVGDSLGWYDSQEKPAVDYQQWADAKNFSLGDFLNTNHSVVQTYNFTTYKECDYDDALDSDTKLWSAADPSNTATSGVTVPANLDQLKLMGPVILNGILKLLDGYSYSDSDSVARDTKSFAFQAIGLLAQRLPQLFRDKIEMAVRLFDALKLEASSLRLVIQEATTSLATAYKVGIADLLILIMQVLENTAMIPFSGAPIFALDIATINQQLRISHLPSRKALLGYMTSQGAQPAVLIELEKLLLHNFNAEQSEIRFCAVRWATSLFDLQHCPSRFICMLGAADPKLDIREMALEGLFPVKDEGRLISQNPDIIYPKLGSMLEYILKQQPKFVDSTEMREHKLLFPSNMYVAMIKFLLKCFELELEQNKDLEKSLEFVSSVETLCLLLEHAMATEGSVELHATASKTLITIASHLPEMIASHYSQRVIWLKQLLSHMDWDTREAVARLLGIASTALPSATSTALISELVSKTTEMQKLRFEAQHGVLCAIGYVTANSMCRSPAIPEALFQSTLKCLVDVVNSETATLSSVAMQALGHIGLCAPRLGAPSIRNEFLGFGSAFRSVKNYADLDADNIRTVWGRIFQISGSA
ncbi:hypothetical protein KPL71_003360 [Citrus sinensis]|uniref:Uncharacterized protein n=1 Tax=Citrus sinensis TaxID=2711 RepID=A0ACB8MYA9_CITSI|nr:hypothetical protein KPL71_003360 [Citrus sinensis]